MSDNEPGKKPVSLWRWMGRGLAVLAAVGLVALGIALWAQRDIPATVLEARYGGPPSKFIEVDGVRMHYRDEGSGPVVLLIHANFSNLLDWEPWVVALKDRYRVIRFDMTSHGLTGPDPTGDYTLARTLQLTEDFIDALKLEKVTLAGTSLGGTVAIHYTARHPERVERLVLLSPGSLEGKERRARGGVPKAGYVLKYLLPRALPRFMLSSGFGDPARLPESLVDRWYDLWLREGQREAQLDRLSQYKAGDIEGLIRSLRVPVLLMWGELNTTAVFSQSKTFLELLSGAPAVKFIAYPGLGHMALQEDGARLGRDVRAWLDEPAGDALGGDATLDEGDATLQKGDATFAHGTGRAPFLKGSVPFVKGSVPSTAALPSPASPAFCVEMQRRMAGTVLTGENRLFDDMAAFRHSKPRARPFQIYQVVTYDGARPIRVSCKMKTAAHLRAVYGEHAAGLQRGCPDMTRVLQAEAVAQLRRANQAQAASQAAAFVVDADAPFVTGQSYLKAYPLSHRGPDGRVHLRSVGLFQDYDSWITPLLPEILQGQSYCHWPTVDYLVALATGAMTPGTVVTTEDEAAAVPA
jgi:pimeloyl-ACP methyl ester carboxylesterase